jgi:arabinoxylan arabinofuranohydrolase
MHTTWKRGNLAHWALPVGVLSLLPSPAYADNPIVQTNYTADPAPMVHEGKLYVYTSHDEDVTVDNFYTMNDWRLYSTEDMVNWTDHGSPAGLHTFDWSTDSAWAPQGIFRNDEFFLYVPLNNNTGARIGVGVSDNIAGPFMDPLGTDLAQSASADIDPTVFIDDDGQAYMYWGNATLKYVRLNEDMISYSGSPTDVPLAGFTEGPWFYKREGTYYMVYAGMGGGTEKITYATSTSPTGPWTARSDIMAAGSTYTNHAGIVDYKGHSYFFYHNSALPGGNDFKRSVCVEEFTYGSDGSIPLLTMSDDGPDAIETLNPFAQVEAETIAFSSGLKTETCDDAGGGLNVNQISPGDYIKVGNVDFIDGVTSFDARVSGAGSNATIELHVDSQTGPLLGTCDVSNTSAWTTKTCTVSGGSGTHDLFLVFGGGEFKFNWWKFSGPTMPSDGTGGASGTGGSAGSGGVTGVGGSGVGGSPTASGGSGGTTALSGGSSGLDPGTGGGQAGTPGTPASGGCSWRGALASSGGGSIPLWLVAAGAVRLVRRRRSVAMGA